MLASCSGPYSILSPAGESAREAARLWWLMFGLFTPVLLAVTALWIYAMRRHRNNAPPEEDTARRIQQYWIWGGGIALPLASIVVILAFGVPAGHRMLALPPEDGEALRIDVTGHQWRWEVRYPGMDITLVNEMHLPADVPVDVRLTTADVIHSFWVPRLAGKLDAIPGRVNVLRLRADAPGEYGGHCAEYCGLEHAHMKLVVRVHTAQEYERWLREVRDGKK